MASTKITYQDILKNSHPVFDPALKAEIENRLKRVNASARTNPNVLHRRSKAFQKAYVFLSEIDYNEVERLKTLPGKIDRARNKKDYHQRAAIISIRNEFSRYVDVLFYTNLDMDFIRMDSETELILAEYTHHTYKDLL